MKGLKKKVLSLILTASMGCFGLVNMPYMIVDAQNSTEIDDNLEEYTVSKQSLFLETDVITQDDYEQGFQNYANNKVDFTNGTYVLSQKDAANVVGVVKDYDDDSLICGATIYVDGNEIISTGKDGRFQVANVPNGKHDWMISAEGYSVAHYLGYDVDNADGTTIFTFYISRDFTITKDRDEIIHEDSCQTMPPDLLDKETFAISSQSKSMSTVPNVSKTVNVYYNGSTRSVNRQAYIYTVLSSELYGTSYYTSRGLTLSQVNELYCAQAVAANTFLEYSCSVYSNHSSSSYNVCSTTCCQVYDPTKVTQAAIDATANIFFTAGGVERTNIVMYKTTSTTYDYIWGAFFSSCGNSGTKTDSSQPALQAVVCTDIDLGAGGHRYGFCQMGAAKRAKDGNSASSILLYYYTNCCIASCPMN